MHLIYAYLNNVFWYTIVNIYFYDINIIRFIRIVHSYSFMVSHLNKFIFLDLIWPLRKERRKEKKTQKPVEYCHEHTFRCFQTFENQEKKIQRSCLNLCKLSFYCCFKAQLFQITHYLTKIRCWPHLCLFFLKIFKFNKFWPSPYCHCGAKFLYGQSFSLYTHDKIL